MLKKRKRGGGKKECALRNMRKGGGVRGVEGLEGWRRNEVGELQEQGHRGVKVMSHSADSHEIRYKLAVNSNLGDSTSYIIITDFLNIKSDHTFLII